MRWKSREAAAVALEEPISSLYEGLREWESVEGLLAQSSVILSIDFSKAQILNRACFGKPIYCATSPQGSAPLTAIRKRDTLLVTKLHVFLIVIPCVNCVIGIDLQCSACNVDVCTVRRTCDNC